MTKGLVNLRSLMIGALVVTSLFSCDSKKNSSTPVAEVKVSEAATTLEIAGTYTIVTKVLPETATDKSLTFTSSDEKIATVSETGVVTAVASGVATIEIKATSDVKAQVTVTVKEAEKLVGNWDGTKLAYVLSSGEVSVDDLIARFSTVPADETDEQKTEREETLKTLQNNKVVMEDLWQVEITEGGEGMVTYVGKGESWNDKVTAWERDGEDENGNAKYIFNWGEDKYATECTLVLTEDDKGFFTIGPKNMLKIYFERM